MENKRVKVTTNLETPKSMNIVVYDTKTNEVVGIFDDAAFASVFVAAVSKETIEKYGVNWQYMKEFDLQFAIEEKPDYMY